MKIRGSIYRQRYVFFFKRSVAENGISGMNLEEINTEIDAARKR